MHNSTINSMSGAFGHEPNSTEKNLLKSISSKRCRFFLRISTKRKLSSMLFCCIESICHWWNACGRTQQSAEKNISINILWLPYIQMKIVHSCYDKQSFVRFSFDNIQFGGATGIYATPHTQFNLQADESEPKCSRLDGQYSKKIWTKQQREEKQFRTVVCDLHCCRFASTMH